MDGPYLSQRPELHGPWIGSDNQRFWFLTERYAHLADKLGAIPNRLEIVAEARAGCVIRIDAAGIATSPSAGAGAAPNARLAGRAWPGRAPWRWTRMPPSTSWISPTSRCWPSGPTARRRPWPAKASGQA